MTYEEIRDALDGFWAYDTGATDSGIKDADLKAKVMNHIQSLEPPEHKALLDKLCLEFISGGGLWRTHSPEDLRDFLVWLTEDMECLG